MREFVSGFDFVIVVALMFIIYLVTHKIQDERIDNHPYYSHLTRVVFLRIFSGLIFCCVYIFYYNGGDTEYYYTGTRCIVRMAHKDFGAFLQIMLGDRSMELRSLFDGYTGWPTYFKDANSWAVCRFSIVFYLLGFGSYLGMTIVMDALLFIPVWKFYRMTIRMYPKLKTYSAIALFYIPSVLFWGSGLLKDIWCLSGILAIYVAIYNLFFRKIHRVANVLKFIFWAYVVISIRPYAFYVVFATGLIWIGTKWLKSLESPVIRIGFFPVITALAVLIFAVFMNNIGDFTEGKYTTVDDMMNQAVIIQDDLKRDYYGNNSFDIGTFEMTPTGLLAKFPQASVAGLYRPFLWEARTPFMLMSALENLVLLILSIWMLFKFRLRILSAFFKDGFLCSIGIFVIVFAFFIGLTIANFGALVRYRIILQPFFCLILGHFLLQRKKEKEEDDDEN